MASDSLAEIDGGPIAVHASIFALIERGLKKNPNGPATIVAHQTPDHLSELVADIKDGTRNAPQSGDPPQCLQWTYSQLHGAALKFAASLVAHGIEPGMKVAVLIPSRVEWPLTFWTTIILRLTICSLDLGMLTAPRKLERAKIIEKLQPDVVLVLNTNAAEAIDEIYEVNSVKQPKVKLILEPSGSRETWATFAAFALTATFSPAEEKNLLEAARNDDPTRLGMILFTSGTSSGNPKGCPRHVGSSCHTLTAQTYGRGFDTSSRILVSTANFRAMAQAVILHTWQAGGATVIPDLSLGIKGTLAAIRTYKITFILLIPALLHALVAEPEFSTRDTQSVKDVQLGGEIVTRDIFLKAVRSFPGAAICNGHGMTEGGGFFRWPFWTTPSDAIPFRNQICPLGGAAPGATLRVQDPLTGAIARRDEPGELCLSCDSIIKSYLGGEYPEVYFDDPHGSGKRFFRTGDLAIVSGAGIVYILGRVQDRIKRAGVPIVPAALESCIEDFVGAQTVALPYPHPVLGHEPVAVVRELHGKSAEEVEQLVLTVFGKDYTLGAVLTLAALGLDRFPLNATGKVMRTDLLKRVQEFRSRGR